MRMRQPNIEMQQQMEAIYAENEHLTREIAILRDTIKVMSIKYQFIVKGVLINWYFSHFHVAIFFNLR